MLECALIYSDKYAQIHSYFQNGHFSNSSKSKLKRIRSWSDLVRGNLSALLQADLGFLNNFVSDPKHSENIWSRPKSVRVILNVFSPGPIRSWICQDFKVLVRYRSVLVRKSLILKSALWVQLSEVRLDTPSRRKLHKVKSRVLRRKHHL